MAYVGQVSVHDCQAITIKVADGGNIGSPARWYEIFADDSVIATVWAPEGLKGALPEVVVEKTKLPQLGDVATDAHGQPYVCVATGVGSRLTAALPEEDQP